MAKILTPTKDYYVDNCPVLHINEETEGEHAEGFEENPNLFLYELDDSTRLDVECPSDNNPVSIYVTGNTRMNAG